MESEKQTTERETPPQHWTSYKLIIDPALTKGLYKVCRYDGQCFNIPVEDLGLFPVETVRDPRICRLWSKSIKTDLLVPKFQVDEWYVGPVPPKEVTFSRLNDNVREVFLTNMCKKYGNIEDVEIFCNPENKKHLGIAKVVFDTVRAAKDAVQNLHQTSVMGNVIHVEIDPKGENRARYIQLLLSGLYTPRTLPVGSSERALQSLIDSLLDGAASQHQGSISSPTSIATPLSLDTAYSSIWQDTPCSFRLTPLSQGTPRTPCFSATPLSQDSCYSSLQATPILQGEPSTYSVHKPLRQELCLRKPSRYGRGSGRASKVNFILKQCQSQPAHLFSNQRQTSSQQLWSHNAQSSAQNNKEASFNLASPFEGSGDVVNTSSTTLPLNCNSFSILSINFTAEQQTKASSPPDDQQPEAESLDSRIESLLVNNQISDPSYLDRETLEADGDSQGSPASPCSPLNAPFLDESLVCTPTACESFTSSHQHAYNNVVDPSSAILVENEEDETTQAVSFLTRNSQSPVSSDYTYFQRNSHIDNESDSERSSSLSCQKEHQGAHEDKEHSNNGESGALAPADIFLPEHPSISSLSSTAQHHTPKTPPAVATGCSHPSVAPFPFPIPPFPPSVPPVPPRLPNGVIPIPPPGWIPPLGIPIPPPPIPPPPPPSMPPPPTFLGCPPPMMMPPPVPPPVHFHGSAPLSFPRPAWSAPPFPTFNPFVPPPDYQPVQENPHKITAEKVLEVLLDELKSIIRKDLTRRMIEGVAFKAFEDWWNCQEKKAKIQASPLKSGATSVQDRKKLLSSLSHSSGQGKKPPLPSFKVKRKRSEETENEPCSTHESSNVKHREDVEKPASDRAKRRHARPLELDSDDDNDDTRKEEDSTLQDEGMILEKVEAVVPVGLQIMSDRDDHDDGDDSSNPEQENELGEEQREEEAAVVFQTADGVQHADNDFSESSSSEKSSSDFDSSESFYSESFEDSSSDFSTEDKDMDDDEDDGRSDECIVISSDEDSTDLEPPPTPSAPLTPGAQLDLDLQDWSDLFHREETVENQYASYQQDACNLDAMMELQTSERPELQPPSPIGFAAEEPGLDVEMEIPEWIVEPADNIENLRPLTPTGCLVDSDPDVLIKNKPKSPTVEEVERPQTPGKGIVTELESEHSNEAEEVFSLSPANSELIRASSDVFSASCPLYQEMPKTPGREGRSVWTQYSSARVPATPGREMAEGTTVCSSLNSPPAVLHSSSNPYITAPKTPGRDIILPRRAIVHKRKTQRATTSLPLLSNGFVRGSPVTVSSPSSLSESASNSSDGSDGQTSSGVRAKPLQGLENMPGLLDEEKSLMRQKLWRRLKRRRRARHRRRSRKRITGSLSSARRPLRWRSLCEERRILHNVWKEGLDEEDARLLQSTYERLQEQDNGFGWLSDTLWIPHPLTKVLTEKPEELKLWQPSHRTGSARSEGFYKISRKDKMKYLNNSKLAAELPSTSAQGVCIPTQQPASLRAGSDFRSEQRRLLSSFSCDSDLVKFNQLKFRKKRICFSRSHIHEWGLFAMEPIAADEMVIEYVGQIIRQVIADMREQRYEEEGIGSSYLFRIDQDTIIDATKCGNLARFINHSCNPNCYAKIITVESHKKIVIYSRQPINIHEEITYDYKFPIEDTKIPCLCGADSCRGSLN